MKIVIYKENKPKKGDSDYRIEFPKETSVISLDPTIQILFVMDKDINDTRKILDLCRPWNYVRGVVFEGGLEGYLGYYEKISEYQYIDDYKCFYYSVAFYLQPFNFEEPELKGNKDIELIKNNISPGIMPVWGFRKDNDWIYGSFRKKGWLGIIIGEDNVWLRYYRRSKDRNTLKGYYTYTYNNIQEALPMINKIIKEMGYV